MFNKAVKSKSKLRCAIMGCSGSGKTYSSLAIASGLGNKIALIDTEKGSATKYADKFEFDVCEINEPSIDAYINAIDGAGKAGYEVLIIDSMSHAWEFLLEYIEKVSNTKFRGNSWSAWSQGTPLQNKFINSILNFNGHVICTMRTKTEWSIMEENGKKRPVKLGMAPEQRKNIEYEFDLLMEITQEHIATISKDRTGKFQDKIIEKPGKKFGEELKAWLNEGEDKPVKTTKNIPVTNAEDIEIVMSDFKEELKKCKNRNELVSTFKNAMKWAENVGVGADIGKTGELLTFIDKIKKMCEESPVRNLD